MTDPKKTEDDAVNQLPDLSGLGPGIFDLDLPGHIGVGVPGGPGDDSGPLLPDLPASELIDLSFDPVSDSSCIWSCDDSIYLPSEDLAGSNASNDIDSSGDDSTSNDSSNEESSNEDSSNENSSNEPSSNEPSSEESSSSESSSEESSNEDPSSDHSFCDTDKEGGCNCGCGS